MKHDAYVIKDAENVLRPDETFKRIRVPGWLSALVVAGVFAIIPVPAWLVDQMYSRGFYPIVQGVLTRLSNLFPLAILDLLIVAFVVILARWTVRFVGAAKKRGIGDAISEFVRRLVRTLSIATIVFFVFWGLNYRRTSLEDSLSITASPPTADELQALILEAGSVAGRLRPAEMAARETAYPELMHRLITPFNAALVELNRPALEVPGRPKYSLILTPYFTAAGIDGMIDPLALESIVHPDLLPFERPFVLAHEWSHLAGAADEAEANAIGWLACMKGDDTMAYSASLFVIGEAGSKLPRDRWRAVAARLDAGVRTDLNAIAHRVEREQPAVQQTASRMYDTYLRANRVDDGVASYSRSLVLILAPPFHDALTHFRTH